MMMMMMMMMVLLLLPPPLSLPLPLPLLLAAAAAAMLLLLKKHPFRLDSRRNFLQIKGVPTVKLLDHCCVSNRLIFI